MGFYQRFEQLCLEHQLKPQSKEIQEIAGVSSPAIKGWKDSSVPKITPVMNLARYFDVTTDYLLGLSEVRKPAVETLTEQEAYLLNIFRSTDAAGQFNIIHACMSELEKNQNEAIG